MNKRIPFSLYNILLCLLTAAVAVLLCLAAERAEDAWYLKWDLSEDGITRLSDYTLAHLDGLQEEVIILPVAASGVQSDVAVLQQETVRRMAAHTPLVRMEIIDPVSQPQRVQALSGDGQSVKDGTVFVQNAQGTRIIRLDPEDFLFSRRIGEEVYTIYCGEAQLIGAIDRACTKEPMGVWFLSGHGEAEESDCSLLALQLKALGFEVHTGELPLIQPSPKDILLLVDPRQDLSGGEAAILTAFLDQGGRLVVAAGADTPVEHLPALSALLELYGLGFRPGWTVENPGESAFYVDRPDFLNPVLAADNGCAEPTGQRLILPRAGALATPQLRPGIETTVLLHTSERAVLKADPTADAYAAAPGDLSGRMILALMAQGGDGMRILQLASGDMLRDDAEVTGAAVLDASGNLDFLTACLEAMADREDSAPLDAGVKRLPAQLILFDSEKTRQTVSVLMLTALPGALTILMGIVLLKRRRL